MIKVFLEVVLVFVSTLLSVLAILKGDLSALLWFLLNVMYGVRVHTLRVDRNGLKKEVYRLFGKIDEWDLLRRYFALDPVIKQHVRQNLGCQAANLGRAFKRHIEVQKETAGIFNPSEIEELENRVEDMRRDLDRHAEMVKEDKRFFQQKHSIAQRALGVEAIPTLGKYKDYEEWAPLEE